MPRPYPERAGNARLVAIGGRRLAPEEWNGPGKGGGRQEEGVATRCNLTPLDPLGM